MGLQKHKLHGGGMNHIAFFVANSTHLINICWVNEAELRDTVEVMLVDLWKWLTTEGKEEVIKILRL